MKLLLTALLLVSLLQVSAQTNEQALKKAYEYYNASDYNKAYKQISSLLAKDSLNEEYLILKADILFKQKKIQPAYDLYTFITRLYSSNVAALNGRGILLNAVGQPEDAIADYTKALALESSDTIKLLLYVNRGAAKTTTRDFKGAYDDYMLAYRLDSLSIGTLNNLATVCDEVGKGEETLKYLYKIIAIDSTFIGAYVNIGFKQQQMGNYKASNTFFDKVLKLQPDEPLAYNNRAYNRYKLGDLSGALKDVNKSITLYPANPYAFRNRALVYIEQKKFKEACLDIEKAIQLGFTKMYGDELEKLNGKYCEVTLY